MNCFLDHSRLSTIPPPASRMCFFGQSPSIKYHPHWKGYSRYDDRIVSDVMLLDAGKHRSNMFILPMERRRQQRSDLLTLVNASEMSSRGPGPRGHSQGLIPGRRDRLLQRKALLHLRQPIDTILLESAPPLPSTWPGLEPVPPLRCEGIQDA